MTIESIGCKEQIKTPAASLLRKFKVLPLSTNIISCFPSLFPLRIRVCSPLAFPLSCRLHRAVVSFGFFRLPSLASSSFTGGVLESW